MNKDLSNIRKDFTQKELSEDTVVENPVHQFRLWLNEAIESEQPEPTAMTLCTVSPDAIPSARIVLLKKLDDNTGFWFYTNYDSHKGKDLAHNHHATLNFFWPLLERQVRITGTVSKVSISDSNAYFDSRPLDSRIGAIASPQSQVIESRDELKELLEEAKKGLIQRPKHWGGYALLPNEIEFWQGRASRLHDRIRYRLSGKDWVRERLAP
ncbi:Pyridoxamine 5'-phosphate oxidase [Saccharicrinis carchari]|uniref:Pyridoxine/pyridoxamine 5'-phosphate oxidase n=1 Tax=Saccharicrinis carchari TaxID=1168039 RepID=A0A521EFS4_SACCC|nr:pyridoxamine 5'-phosphate oxidase [Saccharicrinis carchari]SMO82755.1 Pyridoxamine 5'-phosphate oxidase [Saccharicrinis carchari]